MNFDHIRYFLEVARLEHVGRAAKSLAISPSAVSHAVAAIEDDLGLELFSKSGRNIVLTQQGHHFKVKSENLLAHLKRIREEMSGNMKEHPEHLRVAGTHGHLLRQLMSCLMIISKDRPKLTIEAYSMRSVEILQAVARGEIDFGLCFSPLVHPQIEIRKLGTEPLGLCLRSSHPLLKRLGNRPFPFKEL
ncbi:MAG TPA: LysR family transcriptional regulator, partial [Oligoflexus sp.]|uniref:LysR family transcriptional regulator n=1 Tax=Oligoflexus sp. TaxID=1971216 RepID=UPI002D26F5BD